MLESLVSYFSSDAFMPHGTTPEEMQGWGWQRVHHPDHVNHVFAQTQELWNGGEACELTFPLRSRSGDYR